jgi:hypothetical protein
MHNGSRMLRTLLNVNPEREIPLSEASSRGVGHAGMVS